MKETNNFKKWILFIWERFSPLSYIPFLSLYFITHYVFASSLNKYPLSSSIVLYIATLIFFFKLRLFDELKDFESDLKAYPERPLSRGLLRHSEIYFAITICIALELFAFLMYGITGLLAVIIPITYSLLMFREFFARKWLRAHLTLYAISHTVVSSLFSLAILSVLESTFIWDLNVKAYYFTLLSWCLFNIFEFGRKTFVSSEEKRDIDSYSKIYGRFGAILLVISMALCSFIILNVISSTEQTVFYVSILTVLLGVLSVVYVLINKEPLGKIYRGATSAFIALIYLLYITTNYTF